MPPLLLLLAPLFLIHPRLGRPSESGGVVAVANRSLQAVNLHRPRIESRPLEVEMLARVIQSSGSKSKSACWGLWVSNLGDFENYNCVMQRSLARWNDWPPLVVRLLLRGSLKLLQPGLIPKLSGGSLCVGMRLSVNNYSRSGNS